MIQACRSCSSNQLNEIISFGSMPLANSLLKSIPHAVDEPKYPLTLILCRECSLVQLSQHIAPTEMFDDYLYFSSNAETMLNCAKKLVERIIPNLKPTNLIYEVASNDGYLLKNYINHGFNVLGIEPAKNIADYANRINIPTVNAYFTTLLAHELKDKYGSAQIIHANNVLAHVPEINDFVAGLKILLSDQGTLVIEVPYLINMIRYYEFDTIYHEHVFYFSLTSLQVLFKRHQLEIFDLEQLEIHGGSLRLFITHAHQQTISEKVIKLLTEENLFKLHSESYFSDFKMNIDNIKSILSAQLSTLKDAGKKIAAYGASAKGSTLLNYFQIGEYLDFIVDKSPIKQGLFTPGTHRKILDPDALIKFNIDYALLLTWNFAAEILDQQQVYRDKGGKFIIPIPSVEIV